ncbi:MAG TPA: DUF5808 domain-containing protein [Candidatus Saccharimonadales bacterium]|nr:DUF5808 domain-containing protein [Candidatus Saccharimonadales bacterium]
MTLLNWIWLAAGFSSLAGVIAIAWVAPRLSRPDLFFSITVNPSVRESSAGREILRHFRRELLLFSLPSAAMALAGAFFKLSPTYFFVLFQAALFLEIAAMALAYTKAHRRASAYGVAPSMEREAAVVRRRLRWPGGWMAQAGPFLILGAACLYLWRHWQEVPPRFPIHCGIDGQPNGWATKSVGAALAGPVTGAGLLFLLIAILYGITRGGRRVFISGKKGAGESRYLRSILWVLLGLEYGLAVIFAFIALLPLPSHPPVWLLVAGNLVIAAGVILALVVIGLKSGQGGWRLAEGEEAGVPPVADRTPDRCWKGGLFYYNPQDPALWVEKRFGIGWTTNFANPRAWLILGGLLLLGILPFVLMR